jgi:hypothetical protein
LFDGVHGDGVSFNAAVVDALPDARFGVCAVGIPRCGLTVRGVGAVFRA